MRRKRKWRKKRNWKRPEGRAQNDRRRNHAGGSESLITEVLKLKHRDYRLIQICAANAGDGVDVTYSFGKEYKMVGLRLSIMPDDEIVSISDIYAPALSV